MYLLMSLYCAIELKFQIYKRALMRLQICIQNSVRNFALDCLHYSKLTVDQHVPEQVLRLLPT